MRLRSRPVFEEALRTAEEGLRVLCTAEDQRLSSRGIEPSSSEAAHFDVSGISSHNLIYIASPDDVDRWLVGIWRHVFAETAAHEDAAGEVLSHCAAV